MKSLILVLVAFVSVSSYAQRTNLSGVIDALTLDLNGDGRFDRAVLNSPNGGDADLYIYLSRPDGDLEENYLREAIWSGLMWGTLPSLGQNEAGSLLVNSENSAIGRSRWSQTLTIAYRNGQLVVGGITYNHYDTLDQSLGGSCDLNLFTGKGLIDGKKVKTPVGPVALGAWNDSIVSEACGL